MTTILVFQGIESFGKLVGTVQAETPSKAKEKVVEKLTGQNFENIQFDNELNAVYFTAYYPAEQEGKDVSGLDLIAPKFGRERNNKGGNYKWGTVYYSLVNAADFEL